MSSLNEALSKKVDFSFYIEKEISRQYLYNVAGRIINTAIDHGSKHDLVIENLTLLFKKIHGQQISDMQKYNIYKKIIGDFNEAIEISFTKKLIKKLVIGYELLYHLFKKVEHYQLYKEVDCTYLNFILLGIKHNYSTFLIEIDPKSIDLIYKNNADESTIRPGDKNIFSHRNNRDNIWIDNKKVWKYKDDE